MKYFAIEHSNNRKIVGKIPHTKDIKYNCHIWDEPRFIDRMFYEKIDGLPILANAILHPKAKVTDFINTYSVIGFSGVSMLISEKFKNLLENFNCLGVQFFPTYIIQNDVEINNYWQSHIYDFPYDYVDFEKTDLLVEDRDENRNVIKLNLDKVKNENEFLEIAESIRFPQMLSLRNVSFKKDFNLDYFFLRYFENGGYNGTVSERLKNEIEKQGITGIEFRPIELSLNEWLSPGGQREKTYGKI